MVETPDRILRGLVDDLLSDPRVELPPGTDLGELTDILAQLDVNTPDENVALLEGILSGDTFLGSDSIAPSTSTPTLAPEFDAGPTFEDLFQETLAEALGPDPTATFQNIFSDIFTGDVFSPFEQFVMSNEEVLQRQFVTEARALAEQGKPVPTFEDFLQGQKDDLQKKFQFTNPAAQEALNQFIKGSGEFISTPFNQFMLRNFDRLFNDFIILSNTRERFGVEPRDFGEFLGEREDSLKKEFGFTFEGARQNLDDIKRLRQQAGIAESPFANFIDREFSRLFGEFERSDPNLIGSFGEFLGSVEERERTEFASKSPFERLTGQKSGPIGPSGKAPTRIQI